MQRSILSAGLLLALAMPAHAQSDTGEKAPRRYRIAVGAQGTPSYPGADHDAVRPLFDFSSARGDDQFEFEAADENPNIAIYNRHGLEAGIVVGFQSARTRKRAGADLAKVDFTVEPGVFAGYYLLPKLRAYAELRKGAGGHEGVVSMLALDYVQRDGDRWLISVGPRLGLSDAKYRRAYFGVTQRDAAAGLSVYRVGDNVVHSVGLATTGIRQLTTRWGLYGYLAYDRLTGDASRSPITERYGSKNQFYGGLALSYTFGRGVR
ncbi:Outer membrane scaffolding protein for murein synthesis, MipA/OmpV family [Sphingomonas sp. NFR04]|uniref:MipA/OmpV family protein n=1 Tax=Sphingomonas sp. NFR04 TaxID=1566283 RepID=UPI0008F336E9|nr:MipA/OmpV family protein [Sphingomonas sp. NFR04]SFI98744.1 Outer membrane scaffolding protein for murein synthesis, MipA/OmpV family [Sphingomonas sp. NFR04]